MAACRSAPKWSCCTTDAPHKAPHESACIADGALLQLRDGVRPGGLPMRRRDFVLTLASLAAAAVLPHATLAQNYPTRPVSLIVPFAAGGSFDVLARVIAPRMGELLGQQVIVENVTGASGVLGAQRGANAAPDGYTILLGTIGTHAYNPSIFKKLPYDPVKDFTPVGLFADQPMVLVVRKDLPVKTLQEFAAYVKANHGKMSFGSAGVGSTTHLSCALVNATIGGPEPVHVPYRGGGPAMADIMGGRLDYGCSNIGGVIEQIKAGNLKAIAILSRERASVLPDLPSAHEQGFNEFNVTTWNCLYLPKNTPAAIVAKVNEVMSKTVDTPAVIDLLDKHGVTPVAKDKRTPEYLAAFVPNEIKRWEGPIKAANIQQDK
jgi:tripartite-type tricarboxylate transporter receptor subunit TctC